MAVASSWKLPDNTPVTGTGNMNAEYRPLGGDGWTSPLAEYAIECTETGDASGGTVSMTIEKDDRFEWALAYVGINLSGGAAAATPVPVQFSIDESPQMKLQANTIGNSFTNQGSCGWCPTPIFDINRFRVQAENVTTLTYVVVCYGYVFRKSAKFTTPLHVLLDAIPSSQNMWASPS